MAGSLVALDGERHVAGAPLARIGIVTMADLDGAAGVVVARLIGGRLQAAADLGGAGHVAVAGLDRRGLVALAGLAGDGEVVAAELIGERLVEAAVLGGVGGVAPPCCTVAAALLRPR
jgi:hypothetical protein